MAKTRKALPSALRPRVVRELNQEIAVAVQRSRDLGHIADACVTQLKHIWTREGLSIRGLGDLETLASGLSERLERLYEMRGLGVSSAALKFDGAWMLDQVDALTGIVWEGYERAVEPVSASVQDAVDPRVAAASPEDFRAYRAVENFAVGELVRHPKFGDGCVTRVVDHAKIEVRFADGTRTLVQNLSA